MARLSPLRRLAATTDVVLLGHAQIAPQRQLQPPRHRRPLDRRICPGWLPGIVDPLWDSSWLLDDSTTTGGLVAALTGPDGPLKQLTKTVLKTPLNEEMTEHLG